VGSQDEWIGTGSFIKKGTLYYCFYTGHNNVFTPAEKIMLATSTDLMNWTKQPAMALQAAAGYDQNNFRDPQVYWDEGRNAYVMLVTTRKDGKGTLARYQSTDLSSWSMIEPLVATTGTGEKDIMKPSTDAISMRAKRLATVRHVIFRDGVQPGKQ